MNGVMGRVSEMTSWEGGGKTNDGMERDGGCAIVRLARMSSWEYG